MNKMVTIIVLAMGVCFSVFGQDDAWREEMKNLRYSPRYFGPNAFPLPELHNGKLSSLYETELRGEYHVSEGDRTKDVYVRGYIPIAGGLAGIEVSYIVYEYYNLTPETAAERHTAELSWPEGAHGDVVVSSYFQLLKSARWADVIVGWTLKTASGNRLPDARYTDAAAYLFDLNAGRDIMTAENFVLRLQLLGGFYCWMTNDMVHRQNDAIAYSAGLNSIVAGCLKIDADVTGFYGYENNGDRPLQLRTHLEYGYKNNALSLRYQHGFKDALYDTFSVAYKRYF